MLKLLTLRRSLSTTLGSGAGAESSTLSAGAMEAVPSLISRVNLITKGLKNEIASTKSSSPKTTTQANKPKTTIPALPVMPRSTAYTEFCENNSGFSSESLRREFERLSPEQVEKYQRFSDQKYMRALDAVKLLLNKRSETVEVRWPYSSVSSVYVKHNLRRAVADNVNDIPLSTVRAGLAETYQMLDKPSKEVCIIFHYDCIVF